MSAAEILVYVFLVLAADKEGVSYYRKEKIADATGLDFCDLGQAIADLERRGLIAFRPFCKHNPNGFYQVVLNAMLVGPIELIYDQAAHQDHGYKRKQETDQEHTFHQRSVLPVFRHTFLYSLP